MGSDPKRPTCKTILVVEDYKPTQDVIRTALEMEGYHVLTADDGKAAVEILQTAKRPCLILLDLMLPIMNGWEFLEELRKASDILLASLPVVVVSAATDAQKAASGQAQGYMRKPIDLELLYKTVEKFCDTSEVS